MPRPPPSRQLHPLGDVLIFSPLAPPPFRQGPGHQNRALRSGNGQQRDAFRERAAAAAQHQPLQRRGWLRGPPPPDSVGLASPYLSREIGERSVCLRLCLCLCLCPCRVVCVVCNSRTGHCSILALATAHSRLSAPRPRPSGPSPPARSTHDRTRTTCVFASLQNTHTHARPSQRTQRHREERLWRANAAER